MRALGAVAACRARLRVCRSRLTVVSVATLLGAVLTQAVPPGSAGLRTSAVVALYGGLAVVWSLTGGWIGREARSGIALHWAQLPVNPLLLHGVRFATLTATALILAGLPILLVAGSSLVGGAEGDALRLVSGLPGMMLLYLVFAVLVWALGGWGVAGDGWAALLVATMLSVLELVARLHPEWLGPAAGPADVVGLPLDDLGLASAFLAGGGSGGWVALIRVLLWMAGWGVVGAAGVNATSRRRHPPRPR